MAKKALIVYGTRFGATAGTAGEIAKVLRDEGLEVKVVDAKKGKIRDISGYDLVIVGSGIMVGRWTGEPEKFLDKFREELRERKLALFVSSGAQALIEREGKFEQSRFGGEVNTVEGEEAVGKARKVYLEDIAIEYGLKPVAMAVFGGIWDYNHFPWWAKKAMAKTREYIEEAGIKEARPGVYDTRDMDAIRSWAKELAALVE